MAITASYMSDDSDATHVLEGHEASSQFSYRILLTVTEVNPDTLAIDELKLQDIKYSCLHNDDMYSRYEFVLSGGLSPCQRANIGRALNDNGVPLVICDAVVYHMFNVYQITDEEVSGVDARIRIDSNCFHEFGNMDEGEDEDYFEPTPTSKDVVAALEKVVIAENHDELGCMICLEDFSFGSEATKLPCSHIFHGNCIVRWLDNRSVCPLCRFDLPVDAEVAYTIHIGTLVFYADHTWILY